MGRRDFKITAKWKKEIVRLDLTYHPSYQPTKIVVPTSSLYYSTEPCVVVRVLQNRLARGVPMTSIQSCLAFFSVTFFT
jgi:hypothetical protein